MAGWRLGLERAGSEPSVKSPSGGSDDAVRSMKRSLRRR